MNVSKTLVVSCLIYVVATRGPFETKMQNNFKNLYVLVLEQNHNFQIVSFDTEQIFSGIYRVVPNRARLNTSLDKDS